MSRLSVLVERPRRTLGVLAVALAAVGVAIGSGAGFSSQSTNPGNLFTAGIIKQGNTGNGSAVATLSNMLPGQEKTGSITLSNDGNRTAAFDFSKTQSSSAGSDLEACSGVDGGSAACSALSGALKLEVKEGSTVLFDALANTYDPATFNLGPGTSKTLDFRFYLPADTGNAYQGGSYTASYTWDAGQPSPAVTP